MKIDIDIWGLLEKICDELKPLFKDERIPAEVREEYKIKLENAIDSWKSE